MELTIQVYRRSDDMLFAYVAQEVGGEVIGLWYAGVNGDCWGRVWFLCCWPCSPYGMELVEECVVRWDREAARR